MTPSHLPISPSRKVTDLSRFSITCHRQGAAVRLGIGAVCGTLDEEVGRLVTLGAVLLAESQDPFDLTCDGRPRGQRVRRRTSARELQTPFR